MHLTSTTARTQKYQQLAQTQREIVARYEQQLDFANSDASALPTFDEKIISIPNFLPEQTFRVLRESAIKRHETQRSHLPTHKQGGTISYQELHTGAPEVIAFYQSAYLRDLCSRIIGERVAPTPINDPVSCAILIYDQPRDHINWHYDYNFYDGRHFTALLPIVNQHHGEERLSSANLVVKRRGVEVVVPTAPNTFVLFEGHYVYHKVTRLGLDETRIVISMTFCTNPKASLVKNALRRVKDTAYFGVRALWS